MRRTEPTRIIPIMVMALVGLSIIGQLFITPAETGAAQSRATRSIDMGVAFPAIEIKLEEDVGMDMILYNNGQTNEDVKVWTDPAPEGWTLLIKSPRFGVSIVHVPAGEKETLTFEALPDENVKPGKYQFRVHAQTPDGKFKFRKDITVKIAGEAEEGAVFHGIKVKPFFPVLKGPPDGDYEFMLKLNTSISNDAVMKLFAEGPKGWDVNFKSEMENNYISSIQMDKYDTKNVTLEVKPPYNCPTGKYPIRVRMKTEGYEEAEATVTLELTGTYDLKTNTANGLLSFETRQGKPAIVSLYVNNTGSAPNNNITFRSFKPENWKVEFSPERIPVIQPGEFKQVEVTITPYDEALVGDYSVGINVVGERSNQNLEFRATIKASSGWGWIGIAVIVLAILCLAMLFRWLGRR